MIIGARASFTAGGSTIAGRHESWIVS
jgi:hypothetical protein